MLLLRAIPLIGIFILPAEARVESINVPLTADRWRVVDSDIPSAKPEVQFVAQEGFPQGIMVLKAGSMALSDFEFQNGTIEFDIKAIGENIPGIQFRKRGPAGREDGEEFYIRGSPDCRASNDCIQYSPVIHGFLLWNVYPQYQTQALVFDGWNHVKLVISGRRMNVFINRSELASLRIGNLESASLQGSIQFRGPAYFANLVISPGAVEDLPSQATADPLAGDRNIVRHWQRAPLSPLHYGATPSYESMPKDPSVWKAVDAERFGFVNLDREYQQADIVPSLNWLRYSIKSDSNQTKHVSLGWLGQVWLFVNGTLVAQAKNFYYPESERRQPDGRLSFHNGSFDISLVKGNNEIAIALFAGIHDDDHTKNRYGWGLEMRYDNVDGVNLPIRMKARKQLAADRQRTHCGD